MEGHVACSGEKNNAYSTSVGKSKEEDFLEDLDIDERIIFK